MFDDFEIILKINDDFELMRYEEDSEPTAIKYEALIVSGTYGKESWKMKNQKGFVAVPAKTFIKHTQEYIPDLLKFEGLLKLTGKKLGQRRYKFTKIEPKQKVKKNTITH